MSRILPRYVGGIALALVLSSTLVEAAEVDREHSYELTIESHLEMDILGNKTRVDADTVLNYTWSQRGSERTLTADSMQVHGSHDGTELMNTFASREKWIDAAAGQEVAVTYEQAPDSLKQIMRDTFGAPIFKLQVTENGNRVNGEVIAGPGASNFITQKGLIAAARFFHPPFMYDQDQWSSKSEINMGYGGFAKGELSYEKIGAENGQQAVRVSGTLGNEAYEVTTKSMTIRNAKYDVRGEQRFALAEGEWVSGKIEMNISFELTSGERHVASAHGTMTLTLRENPVGNEPEQ
jgi:hypothetical protein